MFLTDAQMTTLTGRKTKKARIKALRTMFIPFYVNAIGEPVVARSTIEGRPGSAAEQKPVKAWRPNVLNLPSQGARHGKKTDRQSQPAERHASTA